MDSVEQQPADTTRLRNAESGGSSSGASTSSRPNTSQNEPVGNSPIIASGTSSTSEEIGPSSSISSPFQEVQDANSNLRQRIPTNASSPAQRSPDTTTSSQAGPPTPTPTPAETQQLLQRRGHRLQRDTEQLMSIIHSNPRACLCILLLSILVISGFGYFLYQLHLAYKYSSIIHKLHVSSSKDGFGTPTKFSPSSSRSRSSSQQGQGHKPGKSSSVPVDDPDGSTVPVPPRMLDEEIEMYANQLQSVLSSLKRTMNRIDPTSNSTTTLAGLVELKPIDSPKSQESATTTENPSSGSGFTYETHSEDESSSASGSRSSDIKTETNSNYLSDEEGSPSAQQQQKTSFPEFLDTLKKSVSEEEIKAEEKLKSWIRAHRHEYATEEDWNEALAEKREQDSTYYRFIETLKYVTDELEDEFESTGTVDGRYQGDEGLDEDGSLSLGKLLEILNSQELHGEKGKKKQPLWGSLDDDEEDDDVYDEADDDGGYYSPATSDISSDSKIGTVGSGSSNSNNEYSKIKQKDKDKDTKRTTAAATDADDNWKNQDESMEPQFAL